MLEILELSPRDKLFLEANEFSLIIMKYKNFISEVIKIIMENEPALLGSYRVNSSPQCLL